MDFWLHTAGMREDMYGEDGRQPEEPQRALSLTSEEVLRLVVMPGEQGTTTLTRWAMRTFLKTCAIRLATWVVLLLHWKQSTTGTSKPNKNIFVAA